MQQSQAVFEMHIGAQYKDITPSDRKLLPDLEQQALIDYRAEQAVDYKRLRFEYNKFTDNNPKVMQLYIELARYAIASGAKRLSINKITEQIREIVVAVNTDEKYKIPNNHRAFYARELANMPEFNGMFKCVEQRSKRIVKHPFKSLAVEQIQHWAAKQGYIAGTTFSSPLRLHLALVPKTKNAKTDATILCDGLAASVGGRIQSYGKETYHGRRVFVVLPTPTPGSFTEQYIEVSLYKAA